MAELLKEIKLIYAYGRVIKALSFFKAALTVGIIAYTVLKSFAIILRENKTNPPLIKGRI